MEAKFFEALMLICFGAAWPVSIYKSYVSKTVAGKSVLFLFIILMGYGAGIVHKILSGLDYVIGLYALNALMVVVDIAIYARNKKLSAKQAVRGFP